jgi:hypothetical protein
VETPIDVGLDLEYVLVDDGLGTLPKVRTQRRGPGDQEFTRTSNVSVLDFSLEVVEGLSGAGEVLNANNWSSKISPLRLPESSPVEILP